MECASDAIPFPIPSLPLITFFPSGITEDIYVRVDGHLCNPDDGKQPKTFGLNILIF